MSDRRTPPIFLDHASTTPLDPRVAAVMIEVLQGPLGIGNPSSSTHAPGRAAAAAIEQARVEVAQLIGADPRDLVFTSGATEADNLAVLGLAHGLKSRGRHLVTSRTEHKAVLDPCKQLEKRGWQIGWLEPARDGRITPEALAAALREDTQGEAAKIVGERRHGDAAHVERLAVVFRDALRALKDISWNDHPQHRLPGLLSISVDGVEGESLIAAMPSIAVSSGAACDSALGEPSYVLRAQGLSPELAQSTLRISFGRFNSEAEALGAAEILRSAVGGLRECDAPGAPAGTGWHMGAAGSLREGARIRVYLRASPAVAGESRAAARIEALEFRAATCPAVRAVLDELQRRCIGRALADPA
ncbi:MAG: aminotransferase class V-fold PLP-dependent enzyme, partial [Gammaproteobacteria bacterium]|nr:aminotransferase class V-fold PLP-dependent enzyme [Gammaproteobacteria bacterium]